MLSPKKLSPAYSVARHDWTFKWDWLLRSDATKKKGFFAANMGLVNTGIKSTPCTMKYTAVFLMLWAYISAGPRHLV